MHSAKLTTAKVFSLFSIAFSLQHEVYAQENSPYSRYGLGDLVPKSNIVSRGLGGIAAGISDYQGINFTNPASYANLKNTVFDFAIESDTRRLKSTQPPARFSATNAEISYLQLGIPIRLKKANKKDIFWGLNFGLRPVSRINYKIIKQVRLVDIQDSVATTYEGSGGLNQAYIGTALSIKRFSIGVNGGYMFGNKDYSTRLSFLNDTVHYAQSNTQSQTNFGGLFINGGFQYEIRIKKKNKTDNILRLGGYGNLKQHMSATKNAIVETVQYDASGNKIRIDSVFENLVKGKIVFPATFGVGVNYQTPNWLFGADFERTRWQDYRFYGQTDSVQNTWKIRVGAEFFPLKENTSFKKYFSFVRYRFGFYYGPDYIRINNSLPEYGISFGAGLPLKLRKGYYETQTSMLNTAIEFGSRGNKKSNLRENTLRISIGLSLSDLWFLRQKYQ